MTQQMASALLGYIKQDDIQVAATEGDQKMHHHTYKGRDMINYLRRGTDFHYRVNGREIGSRVYFLSSDLRHLRWREWNSQRSEEDDFIDMATVTEVEPLYKSLLLRIHQRSGSVLELEATNLSDFLQWANALRLLTTPYKSLIPASKRRWRKRFFVVLTFISYSILGIFGWWFGTSTTEKRSEWTAGLFFALSLIAVGYLLHQLLWRRLARLCTARAMLTRDRHLFDEFDDTVDDFQSSQDQHGTPSADVSTTIRISIPPPTVPTFNVESMDSLIHDALVPVTVELPAINSNNNNVSRRISIGSASVGPVSVGPLTTVSRARSVSGSSFHSDLFTLAMDDMSVYEDACSVLPSPSPHKRLSCSTPIPLPVPADSILVPGVGVIPTHYDDPQIMNLFNHALELELSSKFSLVKTTSSCTSWKMKYKDTSATVFRVKMDLSGVPADVAFKLLFEIDRLKQYNSLIRETKFVGESAGLPVLWTWWKSPPGVDDREGWERRAAMFDTESRSFFLAFTSELTDSFASTIAKGHVRSYTHISCQILRPLIVDGATVGSTLTLISCGSPGGRIPPFLINSFGAGAAVEFANAFKSACSNYCTQENIHM
eukprot:GILK01004824.1.p1 GENE.GILK01004824.1~~GILK01004824.1.p1  ORF type:complete len:602 (+),score=87.28 GILK01004824.1:29-1834(+)